MTEHEEDWARDLWPEDDDWPRFDPVAAEQLHMGTPPQPRNSQRSRVLLRLVVTAVVAAAAGTGGAVAVKDLSSGSAPSAAGRPSASGSAVPGSGQLPQQASGAVAIGGTVTAVSPRSITIAAGPESVTARVTGSTRFSGKVKSITGVRVGDVVFAQVSADNGVNSLVTLQDPYSVS